MNRPYLLAIWQFSATVSVFMVLPDWFLTEILGSLHFPADSGFKIGGVIPWYMALMWTIPFTLILNCFSGKGEPSSEQMKLASLLSLLIFGAAEHLATPIGIWSALGSVNEPKVLMGNVAAYVLPAEILLGPIILYTYRVTATRGILS